MVRKNIKIGTQLIIGFALVLAFVFILGMTSIFQTRQLFQQTEMLYRHPFQVREAAYNIEADVQKTQISVRDLIILNNDPDINNLEQLIEISFIDALNQFDIIYDRYQGSVTDIDNAYSTFNNWKTATENRINKIKSGDIDGVIASLGDSGEVGVLRVQLLSQLDIIKEYANDEAVELYSNYVSLNSVLNTQRILLISVILIISLIVSFNLIKKIRKPLFDLDKVIQEFQNGHLDVRSSYRLNNEFGLLSRSFNEMADTIQLANIDKLNENDRLAVLVEERTRELNQEHIKIVDLVKDLEQENKTRKQKELELLEAKEYFEHVFNTSPDAAAITRLQDGMIINVNEGFLKITGYSKEDVQLEKGLIFKLYTNPNDRKRIIAMIKNRGFCESIEVDFMHKDGTPFIGLLSARIIEIKNVAYISSNTKDITERKRMEENLSYLSYHDSLTGLFNRRYFETEIKRLNNEKVLPLSVIMGDINGVKLVNDAFGHEQGDKLIIATAKVVQSCCRDEDILCRTGGDEFTIILPNTSSEDAYRKLKEIQSACETYNKNASSDAVVINLSLGCATKQVMEQPFIFVIKQAEDYMYKRKLLEHRSLHSAILTSIKAALLEKNQETEEHCERLIMLSKGIGQKLKLSQKELDELELLARLHDIGKIGIPERILNKPAKLSDEEWAEMKKHPEIGHRIALAVPELAPIANYILYHHERWDGKGYPSGLSREEIPLVSRIIAIVDAYDAMTEDRPYRKHLSEEAAINELRRCSGSQFDPELTKIFLTKVII